MIMMAYPIQSSAPAARNSNIYCHRFCIIIVGQILPTDFEFLPINFHLSQKTLPENRRQQGEALPK